MQEPTTQTQRQADDSPSQTDTQDTPAEPEPEPISEEDQMKQAMYDQYSEIIDNASDYFSASTLDTSSFESTQYVYSLVYMDPNNPQIPQLLLSLKSTGRGGSFNFIFIFNFDESNKQAFQLQMQYPITAGVAYQSGYRGSIRATSDGSGLLSTEWYSGSGEAETRRYVASGHELSSTTEWKGRIDWAPKDPAEIDIDWYEATDKSGLEQIAPSNN